MLDDIRADAYGALCYKNSTKNHTISMPSTYPAYSNTIVYQVKVITGDRRGAGTDANVFIEIYGEKGNSGQQKTLQTSSNNFERGKYIITRQNVQNARIGRTFHVMCALCSK